jgi:hypothetical protein
MRLVACWRRDESSVSGRRALGRGDGLLFHDEQWLGGYGSHARRLLREEAWELCTLSDVNLRPARMTVEELERGLRWLIADLYSEKAVARRHGDFHDRWRAAERGCRRSLPAVG